MNIEDFRGNCLNFSNSPAEQKMTKLQDNKMIEKNGKVKTLSLKKWV